MERDDPEQPTLNRTEIIAALRKSGFPLQTRIQSEIYRHKKWELEGTEVPWTDPSSADQFTDLVATNRGGLVLVVECKKSEGRALTFLKPHSGNKSSVRSNFQTFVSKPPYVPLEGLNFPSTLYKFSLPELYLDPFSYEAEHCVSTDTSGKNRDQRLLERDARQVIRGTDRFAVEFCRRQEVTLRRADLTNWFFVPVVVTTARLAVAHYHPDTVDIGSGEYDDIPEIEEVKWVRFRKAFTADLGRELSDRSVFVVGSAHFREFLSEVEVVAEISEGQDVLVPN